MQNKPKKGECGTCHWFEPQDGAPLLNGYAQGVCCVSPPLIQAIMQEIPGTRLSPQGPQMTPATMGIRPPTSGNGRCEKWRPFGVLPDSAESRH